MDDATSPEYRDRIIGENVARVRAAANRSQADVADEMRRKGFKWSQATVWSVEKGERPLRLAEAEALAAVLDDSRVSDFLSAPLTYLYFARELEFQRLENALLHAARNWADGLIRLAIIADEVEAVEGEAELRDLMMANLTDDPWSFFANEVSTTLDRVRHEVVAIMSEQAEVRAAQHDSAVPDPGRLLRSLLDSYGERQETP